MPGCRNHYIISGCLWIGLYLALVLAPLFLRVVKPDLSSCPEDRDFYFALK